MLLLARLSVPGQDGGIQCGTAVRVLLCPRYGCNLVLTAGHGAYTALHIRVVLVQADKLVFIEICSPLVCRGALKFSSQFDYSMEACDSMCMQGIHQAAELTALLL